MFQPTNPLFRRCLENAVTRVRNQNELAINGHEVQRRLDGVCEKFAVSNYQPCADQLRHWMDEITKHPFVTSSDQVDIHWGVLQLILDIAQNPVDAMTERVIRNKGKLIDFPVGIDEDPDGEKNALIDSLIDINISVAKPETYSDELSDWSDDDSSDTLPMTSENERGDEEDLQVVSVKLPLDFKIPSKELHYKEVIETDSAKWLQETTQNPWWFASSSRAPTNSSFNVADFAQEWNRYLDSLSLGFIISDRDFSTTSEYILIREIIWMIIAPPEECKFFRVVNSKVSLNNKVTTTSCSLPIIQSFLNSLTVSLSKLLELNAFIKATQTEGTSSPPVVYQIYTRCLLYHIHELEELAQGVELKLMDQNDAMTSLAFIDSLEKHLRIIDTLHQIHGEVIVPNWRDSPVYCSSAYLLAKLWTKLEYPLHPLETHLTISILIPSLQAFFTIFDSWWSLGKIHDYSNEFLITEWGEERTFSDTTCNELITKCVLINFLVDRCKDSSVVLAHLSSMGRTHILNEVTRPLSTYDEVVDDFLRPFRPPPRITEETQTESPAPTNEYYCELMELLQLEEQMKSDNSRAQSAMLTSLEIFELFHETQTENWNLPFLDLLLKSLQRVIDPRINFLQHRVAKIFLDEFKIVNHFRNVHWVLLLESPAMYDFYTDLFVAIETEYNNLSAYQLTAKLEACLQAVHPQLESLFTVEIDQHYYKTDMDTILDCLTKLRIEYNFQAAEGVIDFNASPVYNRTFQFLLQIKWAIWLLENLRYGKNFVRVKFFKHPSVLDFSIRRLGILRYWLLSSTKTIHSYLMHDVVESETAQLEKNLRNCTSIARIQKCHENFLKSIEWKCFLKEEQRELHSALQEFLNFILIFRDYWTQLQGIADTDCYLENTESKKMLLEIKIDQLEQTYSNIHHCLAEKLKKESDGNVDGHHGELKRDLGISLKG